MTLSYFRGLVTIILLFPIIMPVCAIEPLPDDSVIWGPILGLVDGKPVVRFHTELPVIVELGFADGTTVADDGRFHTRKELYLPHHIRGHFTCFFQVFGLSENQVWYQWEWGPMRFIVLDSNSEFTDSTCWKQQTNWLETALGLYKYFT
jgi:hypothetical protein